VHSQCVGNSLTTSHKIRTLHSLVASFLIIKLGFQKELAIAKVEAAALLLATFVANACRLNCFQQVELFPTCKRSISLL
jgi:hypothetical protein